MSRVLYSLPFDSSKTEEAKRAWIVNLATFAAIGKAQNLFIEALWGTRDKVICIYVKNTSTVPIQGREHLYQMEEALKAVMSEK